MQVITSISIFGPVEMYALLARYPSWVEIHENYQKRTRRNRTLILSANGPLMLSIPLVKGKTKQAITQVEISYAEDWTKDYLQGIRSAYGNSAFFEYYFDDIAELIGSRPKMLFELYESSHKIVAAALQLDPVRYTTGFNPYYEEMIDIRNKSAMKWVDTSRYNQVFEHKFGFTKGLSIVDLLFNLGPEALRILKESKIRLN